MPAAAPVAADGAAAADEGASGVLNSRPYPPPDRCGGGGVEQPVVLASAAAMAATAFVAPAATIAVADGRGCHQGSRSVGGLNSPPCSSTLRRGGDGGVGAAGSAGAYRGGDCDDVGRSRRHHRRGRWSG